MDLIEQGLKIDERIYSVRGRADQEGYKEDRDD